VHSTRLVGLVHQISRTAAACFPNHCSLQSPSKYPISCLSPSRPIFLSVELPLPVSQLHAHLSAAGSLFFSSSAVLAAASLLSCSSFNYAK
jgi:hypothetical protein